MSALRSCLVAYAVYAAVDTYVMGWRTSYFLTEVVRVGLPLMAVVALMLAIRADGADQSRQRIGWFAVLGIGWQFLIAFGGFTPWVGLLLMVAVVALCRPRVARLPRSARRHLLVVHVTTSVGWLGVSLSMLVLSVVGLAGHQDLRTPAYRLMHVMDLSVVIPLVLTSILTGIALSVATQWGLLRHWWVLLKFVFSMLILLTASFYENFLVRRLAGVDFERASDVGPRIELVVCMVVFCLLLVAATALSVYKPRGLTPWQGRTSGGARRRPDAPTVPACTT